jgi:hypothetical protein
MKGALWKMIKREPVAKKFRQIKTCRYFWDGAAVPRTTASKFDNFSRIFP